MVEKEKRGHFSYKHVTCFSTLIVIHNGSALTFSSDIFLYSTVPRNMDKCGRVGGNWRGRIIADVAATPPTPTFKKEIKAKSGRSWLLYLTLNKEGTKGRKR